MAIQECIVDEGRMEYHEYLRCQSAEYRRLAEKTEDSSTIEELLELATVCEEVANSMEDRVTGG